MSRVQLFGGPFHNDIVAVPPGQRRIFLPVDEVIDRYSPREYLARRDKFLPQPFRECSYSIRQYTEERRCPRRHRSIYVGVFENSPLSRWEEEQIRWKLTTAKWEFPEVSFLYEFEEWWEQCRYRHTGRFSDPLER